MAAHIIDPLGQLEGLNQEVFDIQSLVYVTQSALRFYNEEVLSPSDFFAEIRTLEVTYKKLGELADRLDEINVAVKKAGAFNEA